MKLLPTFHQGLFVLTMAGASAFGIGMCGAPATPFHSSSGTWDDDGNALVDDPPDPRLSTEGSGLDGDLSYEMNVMGRQVGAPIAMSLLQPVASKWNAEGSFRIRYAHHAVNPNDPVFRGWQKKIYTNGTKAGRASQALLLPEAYRNRELTREDIAKLRRSGARLQGRAGMSLMPSQAIRLTANVAAIYNMTLENGDDYTAAEKGTVFVDTASVASNGADSIMYIRGLRLIARGREGAASSMLTISHRINVASSAFQVLAGAMRVYAEGSRKDQTSEFNPSSMFYGFMDMAGGVCGIIFSLFLLCLVRRMNPKREGEEGEARNNVLMGLTELPGKIQNSVRLIAGACAAAGLCINGLGLTEALGDPNMPDVMRNSMLFSGSVGAIGSTFALAGALMITPAGAPLAGAFFTVSSAFIACQTMHDFWPAMRELFLA